jgi:hypothetical protein
VQDAVVVRAEVGVVADDEMEPVLLGHDEGIEPGRVGLLLTLFLGQPMGPIPLARVQIDPGDGEGIRARVTDDG